MPDLPRQIRLAPGDYFMQGQDRRMRRSGLPGNDCYVAFRLGKGFDVEALRRRVAHSPILDWLARARIERRLPLVPGCWRLSERPEVFFHEHDNLAVGRQGAGLVPEVVLRRELEPTRGPLLALDLLRNADGSRHLILSWNHVLMDARGAELVLQHLNDQNGSGQAAALEQLVSPRQLGPGRGLLGWWRTIKTAHESLKWLRESSREPMFSLLPKGPPPASRRNLRRVLSFSAEETGRINERAERLNAGFRRSHFLLAASVRGVHAVAVARGNREEAYLVPVPHDTRRRGSKGPIFSNHLSILFYRVEARQAERVPDIMGVLSQQMANQIRDRFPEACMSALDMFKPLPLGYYVNHLGKPSGGKFASFCFSDSGETGAGLETLLGGRIEEAAHLVATWRPPGFTVVFWTFQGRLGGVLSWVDDCLSEAEVDRFEAGLRTALLEEAIA